MLLRFIVMMAAAIGCGATTAAEPATKSESTPDFCQTEKAGNFHNGGREFCGPVAMSNSLI